MADNFFKYVIHFSIYVYFCIYESFILQIVL